MSSDEREELLLLLLSQWAIFTFSVSFLFASVYLAMRHEMNSHPLNGHEGVKVVSSTLVRRSIHLKEKKIASPSAAFCAPITEREECDIT